MQSVQHPCRSGYCGPPVWHGCLAGVIAAAEEPVRDQYDGDDHATCDQPALLVMIGRGGDDETEAARTGEHTEARAAAAAAVVQREHHAWGSSEYHHQCHAEWREQIQRGDAQRLT